jgi:hypothetical protein
VEKKVKEDISKYQPDFFPIGKAICLDDQQETAKVEE